MNTKRITYKIKRWTLDIGYEIKTVTGYAIDWPVCRMCVRLENLAYRVDHYDSGYSIVKDYAVRNDAIEAAQKRILEDIANGKYALAIEAINREQTHQQASLLEGNEIA
jgi:hypothetical protein